MGERGSGVAAAGVAETLQPIAGAERIEALEVIRGVASPGLLVVNLLSYFRVPLAEHILTFHTGPGRLDRAIEVLVAALLEFEAFALFSLSFGAGVGVLVERAGSRRPASTIRAGGGGTDVPVLLAGASVADSGPSLTRPPLAVLAQVGPPWIFRPASGPSPSRPARGPPLRPVGLEVAPDSPWLAKGNRWATEQVPTGKSLTTFHCPIAHLLR